MSSDQVAAQPITAIIAAAKQYSQREVIRGTRCQLRSENRKYFTRKKYSGPTGNVPSSGSSSGSSLICTLSASRWKRGTKADEVSYAKGFTATGL